PGALCEQFVFRCAQRLKNCGNFVVREAALACFVFLPSLCGDAQGLREVRLPQSRTVAKVANSCADELLFGSLRGFGQRHAPMLAPRHVDRKSIHTLYVLAARLLT